MLKDLAPGWLPGDGLHRGKNIYHGEQGSPALVRVVVSADWSLVGF